MTSLSRASRRSSRAFADQLDRFANTLVTTFDASGLAWDGRTHELQLLVNSEPKTEFSMYLPEPKTTAHRRYGETLAKVLLVLGVAGIAFVLGRRTR